MSKVRIDYEGTDKATPQIKGIRGAIQGLKNDAKQSILTGVGLGAGVSAFGALQNAIGGVVSFFGDSVKLQLEEQRLQAQTAAAIKSTGAAAGVSAEHIKDLAQSLQDTTATSDTTIQEMGNLLLTFTQIRNEAGKGNDVFDQTVKIANDMSVALGQDAKSSAIQLGKALNDPITGLTALRRVGVSFTTQQVEQIKAMQQSGDLMGAQKLILAELTKEFGGSAKAFGESGPGALQKWQNALQDAQKEIGAIIIPILGALAKVATAVVIPAIHELAGIMGSVVDGAKGVGGVLNTLKPGLIALGVVITAALVPAFVAWAASAAAAAAATLVALAPVAAAVLAIGAAVLAVSMAVNNFAMDFGDMGNRLHEIADATGKSYDEVKDAIKQDMAETGDSFEEAAHKVAQSWVPAVDSMTKTVKDAHNKIHDEARAIPDDLAGAITDGAPGIKAAITHGFSDTIVQAMADGKIKAVEIVHTTVADMAQAIRDGRKEWKSALDQLSQDEKDSVTQAARIAELKAALVNPALVKGLKSNDDLVRQQAEATYMLIQEQLSKEGAYGWGSRIAKAWADGLASRWGYAHAKAVYLGTAISGPLKGYSPPREGPLVDIDKWGANIGRAWAEALSGAASNFRLGMPSLPQVPTPSLAGAGVPMVGPSAGGTAQSMTREVHYHLTILGDLQAKNPKEVLDVMRRMSSFNDSTLVSSNG